MPINLEGAIPILGGIFVWLAATGRYNPSKDPAKGEAWRRQWGPKLKILAPIVILFGVLQLFGFFDPPIAGPAAADERLTKRARDKP